MAESRCNICQITLWFEAAEGQILFEGKFDLSDF